MHLPAATRYARSLRPQLSPEAARKLVEYYRELRQEGETDANTGSYRVTVRQLEAMIRLGEARAVRCVVSIAFSSPSADQLTVPCLARPARLSVGA